MKARTMAIARSEPTVWCAFIESFAKVLSGRDRELPTLSAREKPDSLTELAALAGSNKSNPSWTLKTMSRYRLLELKEGGTRHVGAAGRRRDAAPLSAGRREIGYRSHQLPAKGFRAKVRKNNPSLCVAGQLSR